MMITTFFWGCQLLIRPDGLTRPEDKWIRYGFNFFDPNRVGSGSDQPDRIRLTIFFEVIL
jgi:hypothetical protein